MGVPVLERFGNQLVDGHVVAAGERMPGRRAGTDLPAEGQAETVPPEVDSNSVWM